MKIEQMPPFRVSKDADGSQKATSDEIEFTVMPDVGECAIKHRVGVRPFGDQESSRWLYINLIEKGVRIFAHGRHAVVTTKQYLPTFETEDDDVMVQRTLTALNGDASNNQKLLTNLVQRTRQSERNRALTWVRHLIGRVP